MDIVIKRPEKSELDKMGIESWPIWECRPSTFDWSYDERETCYILAGKVTIETAYDSIEIGKGDLVVFPKGLSCVWHVSEAIKKHYRYG